MSVTTMSWSEIPGTDVDDLTSEGFVVKTRSSKLFSLVVSLWICVRPAVVVMSASFCWMSCCGDPLGAVSVVQSTFGQLKSPASMVCLSLGPNFPSAIFSSSMSFMFLLGV